MSQANTTSADQVLISFKPAVAGDCIPDSIIEELGRRTNAEIDSTARNADPESASTGKVQTISSSLALGATEISFSWAEPFANTVYEYRLSAISDPGAVWSPSEKSKTTTGITFVIRGPVVATNFQFIAFPL